MHSFTPVAITPLQSSHLVAQSSSQCSSTNAVSQMSSFGFLLLFLLIGCFCFGRWFQKRCEKQAIDCHQQQVERLERIWKMMTHPEL